jgi:hypothetical protein
MTQSRALVILVDQGSGHNDAAPAQPAAGPGIRPSYSLVSVSKIAKVLGALHHSFTKMGVGEADFHALGCAPRRM